MTGFNPYQIISLTETYRHHELLRESSAINDLRAELVQILRGRPHPGSFGINASIAV